MPSVVAHEEKTVLCPLRVRSTRTSLFTILGSACNSTIPIPHVRGIEVLGFERIEGRPVLLVTLCPCGQERLTGLRRGRLCADARRLYLLGIAHDD